MLSRVVDSTSCCNLDNRDILEKVIVKIGLERIDIQEGVTVEALLDSGVIGLVMSSEFARKQEFKLKKIENSIYIRNMDGTFNKKGPIENVILGIPWLAHHNPEIDWRMGEVKMTRCPEECGKQWRPKQRKAGWKKQKKEKRKKKAKRK